MQSNANQINTRLKKLHDTQHNDIQHIDTQNKGLLCDTQLK